MGQLRSAVIAEAFRLPYFDILHPEPPNNELNFCYMPHSSEPPQSIYIHVPFCAHRCGYCDFTLVAGKDHLIGDYLRALERELERVEGRWPIETLFFGGGTPTHLPPADLARLCEIVLNKFHLKTGYEFSVEANPEGLTAEKVAVLADAGVNRVSLGVQSLSASMLTLLERDHRREDIETALSAISPRIHNVALDFIFAVPGQTLELWEETLENAVALRPQHLSTYGLTFEKGTAFWSRREKNELVQAGSDLEREMYALAIEKLPEAGFEHYEISNFAQPGFRCRHNEVYWTGLPYEAFGPGAARFVRGRRITNHRSVTTWIKRTLAGESAVGEMEELSPEDSAREAIAIGLRRRQGVDLTDFQQQTGFDLLEFAGAAVQTMVERGWVEQRENRLLLTHEGLFFADLVAGEFL